MNLRQFSLLLSLLLISTATAAAEQSNFGGTINGQNLYETFCANCHGSSGATPSAASLMFSPPPPSIKDGEFNRGAQLPQIIDTIENGAGTAMVGFKDRLTTEQTRAIAEYVLQLRGARDPEVDSR